MPYKCLRCDTVVALKSNQECSCNTPNFVKCETIHFLHKDGVGKATATRKVKVGVPPKAVDEILRLACSTDNPSPIASGYIPTITCPDCLAYIESIRPKDEDAPLESSASHPETTTTDNHSGNPDQSEFSFAEESSTVPVDDDELDTE